MLGSAQNAGPSAPAAVRIMTEPEDPILARLMALLLEYFTEEELANNPGLEAALRAWAADVAIDQHRRDAHSDTVDGECPGDGCDEIDEIAKRFGVEVKP